MTRGKSFVSFFVVASMLLAFSLTFSTAFAQGKYRLGGNPAPAAETAAPAAAAEPAAVPPPAFDPTTLTQEQAEQVYKIADTEIARKVPTEDAILKNVLSQIVIPEPQSGTREWDIILLIAVIVVGIIAMIALLRGPGTKVSIIPREREHGFSNVTLLTVILVVGIILALSAPAFAAVVTISCKTDKGEVAVLVNDGSTTKMVCPVSGIPSAKIVEFKDSTVTAANVTLAGGKLSFDLTVGKGATIPNEPMMLVDGKEVGQPIAILDLDAAAMLDLTLRKVKEMGVGSSANAGVDQHLRLYMQGFACPTKDPSCIAQFKKEVLGDGKGTSTAAGANLRNDLGPRTPAGQLSGINLRPAAPAASNSDGVVLELTKRVVDLEADQDANTDRLNEVTRRTSRVEDRQSAINESDAAERDLLRMIAPKFIKEEMSGKGGQQSEACQAYILLAKTGPVQVKNLPKGCVLPSR